MNVVLSNLNFDLCLAHFYLIIRLRARDFYEIYNMAQKSKASNLIVLVESFHSSQKNILIVE